MRINAGQFKGLPIITKDIAGTRPTSDKVKQAIFNILGHAVEGAAVLDLFSGFGCLGLEALSRGAKHVVFVDSNPRCTRIIRENMEKMHLPASAARVMTRDVFRALKQLGKEGAVFGVIVSDAPYTQRGIHSKLLNAIADSGILAEAFWVVLQHTMKEELPCQAQGLRLQRTYRYSETSITAYKPNL